MTTTWWEPEPYAEHRRPQPAERAASAQRRARALRLDSAFALLFEQARREAGTGVTITTHTSWDERAQAPRPFYRATAAGMRGSGQSPERALDTLVRRLRRRIPVAPR